MSTKREAIAAMPCNIRAIALKKVPAPVPALVPAQSLITSTPKKVPAALPAPALALVLSPMPAVK